MIKFSATMVVSVIAQYILNTVVVIFHTSPCSFKLALVVCQIHVSKFIVLCS